MDFQKEILSLNGLRKTERQQKIRLIGNGFYNFLRYNDYKTFTKSFLLSFFPLEMAIRTRQKTLKEILTYLIDNKPIKKESYFKPYHYLVNNPLFCYDSSSYSLMMKKNGFIKVTALDEDKNGELFAYSYLKPTRQRDKMAVYSNSPLSIRKVVKHHLIENYVLLSLE